MFFRDVPASRPLDTRCVASKRKLLKCQEDKVCSTARVSLGLRMLGSSSGNSCEGACASGLEEGPTLNVVFLKKINKFISRSAATQSRRKLVETGGDILISFFVFFRLSYLIYGDIDI